MTSRQLYAVNHVKVIESDRAIDEKGIKIDLTNASGARNFLFLLLSRTLANLQFIT